MYVTAPEGRQILKHLPPLRGLCCLEIKPGLTPWARFCCRFAALGSALSRPELRFCRRFDPSPTLDTTREDREWTTESQEAAQHFRKAARDFQMPHGIFGSNSGFANRARHLPEAAFLLEKPCSILRKQPATLRCHTAPPESSSETSRFTSVVGSLSFGGRLFDDAVLRQIGSRHEFTRE